MSDQLGTPLPSSEVQPPAEGQPPASGEPAEGTPGQPLTVEEVEAQWKHRVSQKDRAHAAAEQALREQNDALNRQLQALTQQPRAGTTGQSGNQGEDPQVAALREQLTRSQQEMEREKQARALDARRMKYPALAQQVGDAGSGIFQTADEATLAKLNALADSSGGGTFAPTSPRRPAPTAGKSLSEMNKAELENEMKRQVDAGALRR